MKIKKTIALFLCLSMVMSFFCGAVYAEETAEQEATMETEVTEEDIPYVPIVCSEEITAAQYEVILNAEHDPIELVPGTDEDEIQLLGVEYEYQSQWEKVFAAAFGQDYFSTYFNYGDGTYLSGNTNALNIESTDLYLPGKNGLDLKLTRKYSNQGIGKTFALTGGTSSRIVQGRYLTRMVNTEDGSGTYIGCLTKDDVYWYLSDGIDLRELPDERYRYSVTVGGETIYFYTMEDILECYAGSAGESMHYEPENLSEILYGEYTSTDGDAYADIQDIGLEYNFSGLPDSDWHFTLPMLSVAEVTFATEESSSTETTEIGYVGLFRNYGEEMSSFTAEAELVKTETETETSYSYTFTGVCTENQSLNFEGYCNLKQHEKGFNYNFVVNENLTGYKYYFYSDSLNFVDVMCPVAVEDSFGNIIIYEFQKVLIGEESCIRLTKITDTYNREIVFTYGENFTCITYPSADGTKTLLYTTENDVEGFENNSRLAEKPVNKFTFTNEAGESTEYYSRKTRSAVMHYVSTYSGSCLSYDYYIGIPTDINDNSNIERIVYPNGLTEDYEYTRLTQFNKDNGVTETQWGVSKKYKTVGGEVKQQSTYSFSGSAAINLKETADTGLVTVSSYNNDDILQTVYSSSTGSEKTEGISTTYTYDLYSRPIEVTTKNNGVSETKKYTYITGYKNLMHTATVNGNKTSWGYYRNDSGYTNIPEIIIYYYSDDENLYSVCAEINATGRKIANETVKQGNTVLGKTYYTYDIEGNVTSVKSIQGDTNDDGEINESDEALTQNFAHSYADGIRTVEVSIENVADYEGNNPYNIIETYEYDIFGNPVSFEDSYGNISRVYYDNASRPVRYTYPNGAEKTVSYDVPGRSVITTDERGARYKYIYDEAGNVLKVQYLHNGWQTLEQYSYDDSSRPAEKISFRESDEGIKETYTYDIFSRPLTKSVYEYPDLLQYTQSYDYQANEIGGRMDTLATAGADAETATIKNTYDSRGRLTKTQYISESEIYTETKTYDYADRVLTETDKNGNKVSYAYDVLGNLITVTYPDSTTNSFTYDMLGRKVTSADALGNISSFEYDKAGRLIRQIMPFEENTTGGQLFVYDKNSNISKEYVKTGENEYTETRYLYDNMGNVTDVMQVGENENIVTRYTYDLSGNVTAMQTGLGAFNEELTNPTVYTYNSRGQLSSITDPMGCTETYNSYDYMGNVLSKTDKNGNTITNVYGIYGVISTGDGTTQLVNTYNKLGQLTNAKTIKNAQVQSETNYTYDPFGNVTTVAQGEFVHTYTHDGNGNVKTYALAENGTAKSNETYTYNNMNRLSAQNVNGRAFTFTYDANGNLTGRTINGVLSETYGYNNAGLLVSKTGANGTYINEYRPDGYKTKETLGTFEKAFMYDDFGRLVNDSYTNGDEVLYSNTYTYDSRGNRTGMQSGNTSYTYTYDLNNRLLTRNKAENGTQTERISRFYDRNGNTISQQTLTLGTSEEMSIGVPGDGTNTGLKLFEYDSFNRLTRYTDDDSSASYTYYADNLRATKNVNGSLTFFTWNGSDLAAEKSGEETSVYSYDFTGVAVKTTGDTATYFAKDTHNDIVAELNGEGAITSSHNFDAFGNPDTAPFVSGFGYTGEYTDTESGLTYLRNRYYEPETGRFVNEDPIRDGLNWYVYCNGNPVMFTDPWGLWAEDGSDERFEKGNPIVYQALSDLSETWNNLNELEKQGIDIGDLKNEVSDLANKVRQIGGKIIVTDTNILGQPVSSTEAVIYADDKVKGAFVASAAGIVSIPGEVYTKYATDGTKENAIKHTTWNAYAVIFTGDEEYVKDFTNAHEFGYPIVTSNADLFEYTQMDLYNNNIGRKIAMITGETMVNAEVRMMYSDVLINIFAEYNLLKVIE